MQTDINIGQPNSLSTEPVGIIAGAIQLPNHPENQPQQTLKDFFKEYYNLDIENIPEKKEVIDSFCKDGFLAITDIINNALSLNSSLKSPPNLIGYNILANSNATYLPFNMLSSFNDSLGSIKKIYKGCKNKENFSFYEAAKVANDLLNVFSPIINYISMSPIKDFGLKKRAMISSLYGSGLYTNIFGIIDTIKIMLEIYYKSPTQRERDENPQKDLDKKQFDNYNGFKYYPYFSLFLCFVKFVCHAFGAITFLITLINYNSDFDKISNSEDGKDVSNKLPLDSLATAYAICNILMIFLAVLHHFARNLAACDFYKKTFINYADVHGISYQGIGEEFRRCNLANIKNVMCFMLKDMTKNIIYCLKTNKDKHRFNDTLYNKLSPSSALNP